MLSGQAKKLSSCLDRRIQNCAESLHNYGPPDIHQMYSVHHRKVIMKDTELSLIMKRLEPLSCGVGVKHLSLGMSMTLWWTSSPRVTRLQTISWLISDPEETDSVLRFWVFHQIAANPVHRAAHGRYIPTSLDMMVSTKMAHEIVAISHDSLPEQIRCSRDFEENKTNWLCERSHFTALNS